MFSVFRTQVQIISRNLQHKRTYSKELKFTIQKLHDVTTENRPGLIRMIEIYAKDDPLLSALKIAEGRKISDSLINYILGPIKQGLSFVAIDDKSNEIIGMIVNHIDFVDCNLEDFAKSVEDECEKELVRLWLSLGSEPKHLRNKEVYHVEFNIVDPKYRKSKVAITLGKEALRLGDHLKVKYVRSECSNAYTTIVAEKMGYVKEHSIAYADMVDSKGRQIFSNVQYPHTHLDIFVLYMENLKRKPYLE